MEIIGSIVLGIGLIALGAALFISGRKRVKRCTTQTVGRITGVRESEDRDSDGDVTTDYTPEFEFVVNGQVYHGTANISYNRRRKVKIGGQTDDKIQVVKITKTRRYNRQYGNSNMPCTFSKIFTKTII